MALPVSVKEVGILCFTKVFPPGTGLPEAISSQSGPTKNSNFLDVVLYLICPGEPAGL
jgi:hypothetical protein